MVLDLLTCIPTGPVMMQHCKVAPPSCPTFSWSSSCSKMVAFLLASAACLSLASMMTSMHRWHFFSISWEEGGGRREEGGKEGGGRREEGGGRREDGGKEGGGRKEEWREKGREEGGGRREEGRREREIEKEEEGERGGVRRGGRERLHVQYMYSTCTCITCCSTYSREQ